MKYNASDLLSEWFENLVGSRTAFVLLGLIAAGGFLSAGLYIFVNAELTISYRRTVLTVFDLPARLVGGFLCSFGIFLHARFCWFSGPVAMISLWVQRISVLSAGLSLVAAIATQLMK